MAVSSFSLYTNQLIENTNVTGNGNFTVLTSPTQNNTNGMPAIKVVAQFSEFTPDPVLNPTSYSFVVAIETSNNNGATWFPLVTQFDPLRNPEHGSTIILVAAPNIFNPDEGISYDDWNGFNVVSRTSRRQDSLGAQYRVRLMVNETNHGQPGSFQSVKVSISGERYDIA